MQEQLDYLIEHTTRHTQCGCSACQRYIRVRSILLEIFSEAKTANVREIALPFAKAA
jgi:hypothetical protein